MSHIERSPKRELAQSAESIVEVGDRYVVSITLDGCRIAMPPTDTSLQYASEDWRQSRRRAESVKLTENEPWRRVHRAAGALAVKFFAVWTRSWAFLGAVPIVRETGRLYDWRKHHEDDTKAYEHRIEEANPIMITNANIQVEGADEEMISINPAESFLGMFQDLNSHPDLQQGLLEEAYMLGDMHASNQKTPELLERLTQYYDELCELRDQEESIVNPTFPTQ